MAPDRNDHLGPRAGAGADPTHDLLARTLGAEAVPALSAGFEARLERRLAAEAALAEAEARACRPPIAGPWRWLLHLYWALAAAGTLWLLDRLDLGAAAARLDGVFWPVLAALLLTGAGAALPFLALRRSGGSLLGLLRRAL
ncbi:MAG TPA: hypothetical protein VLF66_08805 [Thermoanaerobaculia bacterium]|nr:hypothetical protein [Thermoanaerobaculia bacterium]